MALNGDFTRKMPVSIEAEQSVLGSILINPESFDKIASLITADDFYLEEHKNIFETMKELYKRNREIDPVTLIDALVRDGVYDKAGGNVLSSAMAWIYFLIVAVALAIIVAIVSKFVFYENE